jgi:hypothetical protein
VGAQHRNRYPKLNFTVGFETKLHSLKYGINDTNLWQWKYQKDKLCLMTSDRKEFVTATDFSANVLRFLCYFKIIRFQRMARCLKIDRTDDLLDNLHLMYLHEEYCMIVTNNTPVENSTEFSCSYQLVTFLFRYYLFSQYMRWTSKWQFCWSCSWNY